MYCKKCGKKIEDDSSFCSHCGAKIDSNASEERKEFFDGEIHRCPNCGKTLDAFVPICPSCGYELRGIRSGSKIEEFSKKLENIEKIEKQKNLIKNFYVPNTKEDLLEFFVLAFTQINDKSPCSEAWRAKLEQTLIKAKLSLSQTDEYKYMVNLYETNKRESKLKLERDKKELKHATIKKFIRENFLWFILAVVMIAGIAVLILGISKIDPNNPDDPTYAIAILGGITIMGGVAGSLAYGTHKINKKKKK